MNASDPNYHNEVIVSDSLLMPNHMRILVHDDIGTGQGENATRTVRPFRQVSLHSGV